MLINLVDETGENSAIVQCKGWGMEGDCIAQGSTKERWVCVKFCMKFAVTNMYDYQIGHGEPKSNTNFQIYAKGTKVCNHT